MVGHLTFDQVYALSNLGSTVVTHSTSTSADDIQAVGDTNEREEPSDITRGTPVFVYVQPETLICKRPVEDQPASERFLRCGHCAAKLKRAAGVDSDFASSESLTTMNKRC